MPQPVKIIDFSIKDELLRYPTVELVRKLFPEVSIRRKSVICNPLRSDKHPSLSFFRDYAGHQRWKDQATGESGDNIDFFRKVYPGYDYAEAVNQLSLLVLSRSAYRDYEPGDSLKTYQDMQRGRVRHWAPVDEPPVLSVISDSPYIVDSVPKALVDYTRSRGISDEVAAHYLRYVVYENRNRKGQPLFDVTSGLPVVGADGEPQKDEGRYEAVAMYNDIGGFSLRVPPGASGEGFKGANMSFITTIPSNGDMMLYPVSFVGPGEGYVSGIGYDSLRRYLSVNPSQGFIGVEPWAVRPAVVFLDRWMGRYLEGRELKGAVAVLNSLNVPPTREVDVVEGMFDAVSVIEFERMSGRGIHSSRDIIVLNSISNIQWAVPYLSVHPVVRSLLDNDMRSAAGQKAFDVLRERVSSFSSRLGVNTEVRSDSGVFYPHKDINDFLMVRKGFQQSRETSPSGKRSALKPRKKSNQVKP